MDAHSTKKIHLLITQKIILGLLIWIIGIFTPACAFTPREITSVQSPPPNTPVPTKPTPSPAQLTYPQPFEEIPPIWADTPSQKKHQVALFRHTFSSRQIHEAVELHIFADTRYEVWIDGSWIGRGPARFSDTLHEYDVFPLTDISPGEHFIAVLSQWAPNVRRSESTVPQLKARVIAKTTEGLDTLTTTDQSWQSIVSEAWQPDATLVHEWKLIGPTELVDLRKFPINWHLPGYQDSGWSNAVVLDHQMSESVRYRPRTIPLLVESPIPVTVRDVGGISPDFVIGEITPELPVHYELSISAVNPTTATFEILVSNQENIPETVFIEVDGFRLDWQPAGPSRPDVYQSTIHFDTGPHRITYHGIPTDGLTFGISKNNLDLKEVPFDQGIHAGRRTLLAQLISDKNQVSITEDNNQLSLAFTSLPSYAILDLGRTVHGRLVAEISGESGSIVDIGWDERLTDGRQRPLPFPGSLHPEWNQVDSWILDGTTRTIRTIDARSGRYILITAWGKGEIKLRNIRVLEEHYPVRQIGNFYSSDDLLNRIWQVGADTLIPNMLDAYVDTPWRERGQWWGDAYVANRINQVVYGDDQLIRRGIAFMADSMIDEPAPGLAPSNHGHHMLDYTMLWVHSLAETIKYGPIDLGKALALDNYTTLTQFMDHLATFENPDTGLLNLPEGHWSQNAYIDTFGWHSRVGQLTALNALYYGTLLEAANIADHVSDHEMGTVWREKAQLIKQNLNATHYIATEHSYLSSINDGKPVEPSPHAQAWALVYDLVPEDEVPHVADTLVELISTDPAYPNNNVYGMYWVLEALGKSGRIEQGIDIIRRYYGHMLERGATTWWEVFSIYPSAVNSLSHSWGGAPTKFLTTYVLGASQTGTDSWIITPSLDSLQFAEGTLPLNNDSLQLSWENKNCSETVMSIEIDNSTGGQVVLPFESTRSLHLGRLPIFMDGDIQSDRVTLDHTRIFVDLEKGQHMLTVIRSCSHPE
jgi:alpha-L-rhamnosidase